MKPPVLLSFNLPAEKAAKVRQLAMRLGVRMRVVETTEQSETLAALCGWAPKSDAPTDDPFTDEMLVLANLSGTQLNEFLSGLRQGKIPPIALKAVLTESNRAWSAFALHAELAEEHRALNAQAAARPGSTV